MWKAHFPRLLLLWRPHLACSSSCRSGRLCSYRPEEARGPLHGGVSSSVEQDIGVARHHLTLLHHCHGTVIKETPAFGAGVKKERLATERQTRTTEKCNTSESYCQLQTIAGFPPVYYKPARLKFPTIRLSIIYLFKIGLYTSVTNLKSQWWHLMVTHEHIVGLRSGFFFIT